MKKDTPKLLAACCLGDMVGKTLCNCESAVPFEILGLWLNEQSFWCLRKCCYCGVPGLGRVEPRLDQ